MAEMLSANGDVVSNQDSENSSVLEAGIALDNFEGDSELTNDTSTLNEIQDASLHQGQTLPILKKVIDLSTKIQELKEEHSALSDAFKHSTSSFPDPEILNTLQMLSTEHELLKNKYMKESSEREVLQKKYMKEACERKQYYNELIEIKGNIRVFCRSRPINEKEISNGNHSIVEYDSSIENELQVVCSDSSKKQFKFDHVFRPEDNQEAVFAQTKPIVTSVLDGYNVCIFAYGQTGTGKTFTMEGIPENRGVNYRTVEELFRISEERGGVIRYELLVSMLEVYNEKIRDLLVLDTSNNQQAKKLEIKQAADGTQEVPGLIEARVLGIEDVWELLKSGSRVRSVGSTSANEMSSRSHCLLRVTVKGENLINGQKTRSHLWLVDLAGSERVGKIEVEGERLKESQFINKSLSALGDVIAALASKTAHVPYRNSKLTHMLQSSLGGDCKTLMFVQISPSSLDQGETLCSLNFASRVRGIESGPARKQGDVAELFKYKQLVEKCKNDEKETRKLQDGMQSLQMRLAAREQICRNLQEKIRDLEGQLAEERKTRLKQENRALAAAVSAAPQPSSAAAPRTGPTEKKPPLAPTSKLRMPLRRISNMFPPQPPQQRKESHSLTSSQLRGKENLNSRSAAMGSNTKPLFRPRRTSIAAPISSSSSSSTTTTTTQQQGFKPRRRVSIATLRPESSSSSYVRSSPHQSSGRMSVAARDPRKARYSKLWTPLPDIGEMTPLPTRSGGGSSRFMGSPVAAGSTSNAARMHQNYGAPAAAIALQRKPLVWSPLNLRGLKQQFNRRPSMSMLPRRSSFFADFQ